MRVADAERSRVVSNASPEFRLFGRDANVAEQVVIKAPPPLAECASATIVHPSIEITVTTGNTADIVKSVEENIIDIGLVTMPVTSRSLEITHVLDDEFVAIAPRPMSLPSRATAACLAELPLILFEPGGNTRRLVDKWFATANALPKSSMSLGSVEAIKAMVGAGLGYSILPQMAVESTTRTDFALRPLSPRLHRELSIVIRRDKRLTRGLKAVHDALATLSAKEQKTGATRRRSAAGA